MIKIQPKRSRRAASVTKSTSAPVGGLNVVDAIQGMPTTDAIQLINWIATQYGVRCRKGYREWFIELGAEVRTIMEYSPDRAAAATDAKIFAVTDAAIYDVTTSGNVPVVSQALAGTDLCGRLSHTSMANSAGTFLLTAANTGGYRYFDGTAWATPTFGGGAGQVSGCDPATFGYVQMWKRRAWFHEVGTTSLWYLAVDSVTGVATEFDVGPQLEHGGIVSFIARWTIDAGEGIDDYLVIGGENGDILVYKGTDPASSATFGLVGVWYVGRLPIGQRPSVQFGGDLLVLTATGLQPLSYVTRGGQSLLRSSSVDYLKKIQPLFSELLLDTSDQLGWELALSDSENLLVVLTPPNGTTAYNQYALYTNNNTWCEFNNMDMSTALASSDGRFFYGTTDGKVIQAFTGFFDNVAYGASTGDGIAGVIQPSYQYFGYPGVTKQMHLIRGNFLAADRPGVTAAAIADFEQNTIVAAPTVGGPGGGALWDVALWDVAVWSGAQNAYSDWQSVNAIGYAISGYFRTLCVGETLLASIDYIYEPVRGGPQL